MPAQNPQLQPNMTVAKLVETDERLADAKEELQRRHKEPAHVDDAAMQQILVDNAKMNMTLARQDKLLELVTIAMYGCEKQPGMFERMRRMESYMKFATIAAGIIATAAIGEVVRSFFVWIK